MPREPRIDPSMAAAMLGLHQGGASGAAVALALVTYTLEPWHEPTGRTLERAQATAERFQRRPKRVLCCARRSFSARVRTSTRLRPRLAEPCCQAVIHHRLQTAGYRGSRGSVYRHTTPDYLAGYRGSVRYFTPDYLGYLVPKRYRRC